MQTTKDLIKQYYDYFNQGNIKNFLALLHEDIAHDINQGERQIGKKEFALFMERMNRCYKENVKNIIVMVSADDKHAAAEFIVDGTYIATDTGLPTAKGQKYSLPCGAFFEIKDNKIARISNYYNLNAWLQQVGA